jgi:pyruvate/2-oxoglutarate/acetoin dehydrogenase E1 component
LGDYIGTLSQLIATETARYPDLYQFGENILQGSRICGLARHLSGAVINVGNCENTHFGVGFGHMLAGGRAALFVKQLDFVLLAADQIVNTYHLLRAAPGELQGSFTVFVIVCDQGMQGPQSSFNALADLCSLARVDGYTLTNRGEAAHVVAGQLGRPGFRIIALSQRLFPTGLIDAPIVWAAEDSSVIQYSQGMDATAVCLNFSLPQGFAWAEGRSVSLFTAHPVLPHRWNRIIASAKVTGRLIVFDDGKGANSLAHKIALQALAASPGCKVTLHTRDEAVSFGVSPDRFEVAA